MNRKGIVGAVAAVGLVAVLWYVLVPVGSPAEPAAIGKASGIHARSEPSGVAPPAAKHAPLPVGSAEDDGKGWFHTDSAATVAARYRAMRDKRRFVDLAMKAGGGAHMWYVGHAWLKCIRVSGKPGASAEPRRELALFSEPNAQQRARAAMYEGCEGFETRPFTEEEGRSSREAMQAAADPVGRASRLSAVRKSDPSLARLEATALLAENDLHLARMLTSNLVVFTMGEFPRTVYDESGRIPPVTPAQERYLVEQEAWYLTWCRLGIECERGDSIHWHNACIAGNHCDDDFAEAYARSRVQPESHEALEKRSREIEKAIRDRNWKSLGLP